MSTQQGAGGQPGIERTAGELLAALAQPGCPICGFTAQAVARYLDSIAYESVTDLGVREELNRAQGYCALHGRQWLETQNPQATALIYRNICNIVLGMLEAQAGTGGGGLRGRLQGLLGGSGSEAGRALAGALEPGAPCPACHYSRNSEGQAAAACAGALAQPPFLAAFEQHPVGLCLPHFRQVLPLIGDAALLRRVVAAQTARLIRTSAELAEVTRKFDYRFKHEPHGAEFEAPARSIEQIAGRLPTLLKPPP